MTELKHVARPWDYSSPVAKVFAVFFTRGTKSFEVEILYENIKNFLKALNESIV